MIFFYDNVFFPRPYQVIFLRPDKSKPTYDKGIAFKDQVVAAHDGSAFSAKKIYRYAAKHGVDSDDAIVESFEWVPLQIS